MSVPALGSAGSLAAVLGAVSVGLCLWVTGPRREGRGLAWYVLGPGFALAAALVLMAAGTVGRPLVTGPASIGHLWLLAAAAAAAGGAAGAALAFLLQDAILRRKAREPRWFPLPSLARSDAAVGRLAGVALVALTAAMAVGAWTVSRRWGGWRWEARTVGALALWAFLAAALHLRRLGGWPGGRLAALVVPVFLALAGLLLTLVAGGERHP